MCHCEKITGSKNEISRISRAKEAIKVLRNMSCILDSRLLELGWSMREMATPDNMGACVEAIKDMNKGSSLSIDEMIRKCDARISALEEGIEKLKREDREFHLV